MSDIYVVRTDSIGDTDTIASTVHVKSNFEYSFESYNEEGTNSYVFHTDELENPDSTNTYSWDFGDGNTSDEIIPEHEYENEKEKHIEQQVESHIKNI